jgi:hypothetical protein
MTIPAIFNIDNNLRRTDFQRFLPRCDRLIAANLIPANRSTTVASHNLHNGPIAAPTLEKFA